MWSVCWDSGEGQRGLTRGGPVSPHCHREHGHRASVSTVINHAASPLFSPTFSFLLPLPFTLFFLFFSPLSPPSLTLPHPLSLPLSRLLPPSLCFFGVFPLTFRPHLPPAPLSQKRSFPLRLPAFSSSSAAVQPPPPSDSHALTFTVCLFPRFLICFTSASSSKSYHGLFWSLGSCLMLAHFRSTKQMRRGEHDTSSPKLKPNI